MTMDFVNKCLHEQCQSEQVVARSHRFPNHEEFNGSNLHKLFVTTAVRKSDVFGVCSAIVSRV